MKTKKPLFPLIVIGILLTVIGMNMLSDGGDFFRREQWVYSDFLDAVEGNYVKEVYIEGNKIEGNTKDGRVFKTTALFDPNLVTSLRGQGVMISVKERGMGISFLSIFLSWLPMLLLIGMSLLFLRQMNKGGGKAFGFGRSKARLMTQGKKKVTFKDVAGIEEAKEELYEIVEFLKNPHKFRRLGGKIPKGCLLVGLPGTGKTLLARAVAGEASVAFFSISGSDFVEMFVGVGASRVRDMFEQGKKSAPCIIFIDEIDAVGRHRGAGLGGGNDEREQTLNQLLVEMDGFTTQTSIVLIAATNRPDVLDPALLRPGRFDRQIVVPTPDIKGREAILRVHLRDVKTADEVENSIIDIARGTPGFSGADLANLVNEAALLAARKNKSMVFMEQLEEAKDKVMMGAQRRSLIMTEEEKKLTAYHEGGHALVATQLPAADPIHKATIIPRGRALGLVMQLPEKDHLSMKRKQLKANLIVAMAGRIAEEEVFGCESVTTGASNDIKMATSLARKMVTEWGMSDELGPIRYSEDSEEIFLGHSVAKVKNMSDNTAKIVDKEVKKLINMATEKARTIIKKDINSLHALAKALLEHETLTGKEIQKILKGQPLKKYTPSKKPARKKTPFSLIPSTKKLVPKPA